MSLLYGDFIKGDLTDVVSLKCGFTTRISKATRFSVGMSQWRVSLPCLNCAYDGKETQRNPPRKNRKSAFWDFLLFWQSPPFFTIFTISGDGMLYSSFP